MANAKFEIVGLDSLQAAFKKAPTLVRTFGRATMAGALKMLHDVLRKYPARRYGAKADFVSAKQARAFFVKMSTGEIEVPYRRGQSPGSERLGASWTMATVVSPSQGIRGVLGTRVSYAKYVQDEDWQTAMHKTTGWPTIQGVVRDKADDIVAFFGRMIDQILARI